MAQLIARRLLAMALVLFVIITLTFILMHAIPGGPFTAEKKLPVAILQHIEQRYRLQDPLIVQYGDYLKHLAMGDFGPSYKYEGRSVNDIIAAGFPVSAKLGLVSVLLAVAIGLPFGVLAALRHNTWLDHAIMFFSTLGVSVPSFILATVLIYFVSVRMGLLPAAMWGGAKHVVLPALSLATLPMSFIVRLVRSSMLEVLQQDYIRTARAKGLPLRVVYLRHALKNAVLPVVTYLGPLLAGVLTGSFVIESIFNVPGLGRYFVTSIVNRDYTVILGVTVFYSFLLVTLNLLVDLSYGLLDPRMRIGQRKE